MLTNTQVSKLRKPFPNDSSGNIRFSRSKKWGNNKIGPPGGCLVRPLLKTGLSLM